jgi:hypothetical protein
MFATNKGDAMWLWLANRLTQTLLLFRSYFCCYFQLNQGSPFIT